MRRYGTNGDGSTCGVAAFVPQRPRARHVKADAAAQERFKSELLTLVTQLQATHQAAKIEVWPVAEHRLGLKPILRRVWAPIGERPIARVSHRYEWLYLYGFVHPATGRSEWLILPRVNVAWFNRALAEFAQAVGAGPNRHSLLVIECAGWHRSERVSIPEGLHLVFLPPYSPELQPAERLWELADEPLVNRSSRSFVAEA